MTDSLSEFLGRTKLHKKLYRKYIRKLLGLRGQFSSTALEIDTFLNRPCLVHTLDSYNVYFSSGTNFPPELYDGHLFGKESFYDELSKQQQGEMDKIGKVRFFTNLHVFEHKIILSY